MPPTDTYLYTLILTRPELMEEATPKEEAVFQRHFDRLAAARDEGVLILAGPCLDGAFGIVVFRAPSEEAARRFMEGDPAVEAGLMVAALHPFRVSLAAA